MPSSSKFVDEALFRHVLSFPEGEGENEPENDYGKIPHIEQLAFHLVDCARVEPEVRWSSFLIASFSGIDLVCNR